MFIQTRTVAAKIIVFFLCLSILAWAVNTALPAQAQSPTISSNAALLDDLRRSSEGPLRISYHSETGKVRFIGAEADSPIRHPDARAATASREQAARGFLATYGPLFGLTDGNGLTVLRSYSRDGKHEFVRFQQTYQGIPIIGGELIVQMDNQANVLSVSGELLPDLKLNVTPAIDEAVAIETARTLVAKQHAVDEATLIIDDPELSIFNQSILGGPGIQQNVLVWRIEVMQNTLSPIRELVLIDAQIGAVALNFNQTHTVKNRETYHANNTTTLPGTLVCNESDPSCAAGDSHAEAAHRLAGDTYDFFLNEHGRDGIDGAGMTIVSTVHYGNSYCNAFWNGSQMVYGDGATFPLADDVVGHELAHGITNHSSNLFYYYQSGAINESFSDIWGELIDQYQAIDSNDFAHTRWIIGEDLSGCIGETRNMQDPTRFNHPDKMTSTHYYCSQTELLAGTGDNGGVHINSGVNNKAAYLLVDGGTFNGKTVAALGYKKTADIYYEVNTNLMTSASDYADLYDAMIQASINIGLSASEQQAVRDAVDAVEMNQDPTACPALTASICPLGVATTQFLDDIESGGGNWTASNISGSASLYWFVPQTSSTIGFAGPYATSGSGNIWGFSQGSPFGTASDSALAMNNSVVLSPGSFLHFNHAFGFESNSSGSLHYDGGIVEYSTDDGVSWHNAGPMFESNGYNGTLLNTNPLGATSAFSADSRGYMSSRINLSVLGTQGARFRFRIGTDATIYDYGWFIDDVRIYTCDTSSATHHVYLPALNR